MTGGLDYLTYKEGLKELGLVYLEKALGETAAMDLIWLLGK